MKKFVQTVKDIWNIEELRQKLMLTFGLVLVYRLGSHVPLPGVDPAEIDRYFEQASSKTNGLLDLLSAFTGGAFSRASVLALGVMPYISASIIVQLMTFAVPYMQKIQKEGESGRKKITQYTRWLTILICLVQAPLYIGALTTQFLPIRSAYSIDPSNPLFWVTCSFVLIAGTVFTMWLGEKISDSGIGNGVSIIIMVGIIARFPVAMFNEYNNRMVTGMGGPMLLLIESVIWLVVIAFCIILTQAVRKVNVQYARQLQGTSRGYFRSTAQAARQYVPLKVNAAGVMPIIFAQAIMVLPISLIGYVSSEKTSQWVQHLADPFGLWYNVIFFLLIVVFTFFYTAITIPVNEMAENLKRNGGFVPGVRPGKDTANYFDDILSRITLPGSIFLAFIAIFPALVRLFDVSQDFAFFFGGTSLIIMVGVILDTIQQVNAYLLNRHYDGLLGSGRRSTTE